MTKAKGRKGGAVMMTWLFFAHLFEPRKDAAIEHIDTQRRIGADHHRSAATPSAPPPERA